ncbi:ABC transporter substrate-binding protein [Croceimicrobium sp.]|uniref:ABC transporter substrate-binding protein n=1 Tax=Croceimicrobium sp. TaxID=2828340 RepID=UPI003BAB593C
MRKLVMFAGLLLGLQSCNNPVKQEANARPEEALQLDTLRLALDWTPNVLHSGIFYAESQNWFREAGIHLIWDTPERDNYTKKPIFRLLEGEVDLAVGPSEHLFAFAADSAQVHAQAVASILQSDRSAFVAKKSSGINRPADISNATYLGYHTPLEEHILKAMIEYDGAEAKFGTETPDRLQVWDAFRKDSGEVAWVFLHWEAMQSELAEDSLNAFIPNEYGVPYGYSSVIMAPKNLDASQTKLIRRFLDICRKAYRESQDKPDVVLDAILDHIQHPNFVDHVFIRQAFADIRPHFGASRWGVMSDQKWSDYAQWLESRGLNDLKGHESTEFYSNEFLESK